MNHFIKLSFIAALASTSALSLGCRKRGGDAGDEALAKAISTVDQELISKAKDRAAAATAAVREKIAKGEELHRSNDCDAPKEAISILKKDPRNAELMAIYNTLAWACTSENIAASTARDLSADLALINDAARVDRDKTWARQQLPTRCKRAQDHAAENETRPSVASSAAHASLKAAVASVCTDANLAAAAAALTKAGA
jgi:hypothetical protein